MGLRRGTLEFHRKEKRIKNILKSMYTQDTLDGVGRNIRHGILAAAGLGDENRLTVVDPLLAALEGVSRVYQQLADLAATDIDIRKR